MNHKNFKRQVVSVLFSIIVCAVSIAAQTAEFTYQGKLSDSGTPSLTYDFEFRLCDSLAADCTAPLGTQQRPGVTVSGGVFTVKLDFGAAVFDGTNRWLEIAVKRPAQVAFSTLAPRQPLTSAPYSIKSLKSFDAENLGGVPASSFLQNNGDGSNLTNVAKLNASNVFTGSDNTFPQITLSGDGQIIAPRLENSAADPAPAGAANAGRVYFNTTSNSIKVSNGTDWVSLSPSSPRLIQTFYANTTFAVISCTSNIRSVSFTKNSASTRLRVTYRDSPYAANFGSFSTMEVVVRIDGAAFSPVSLSNSFRVHALGGGSFDSGEEETFLGYAEGISAGTHTLTTNYSPFMTGAPACYRPAKYLIEIEELP